MNNYEIYKILKNSSENSSINIDMFDVITDGVTNDKVKIQAAIDSLKEHQTLVFNSGTYYIDGVIQLKSNIKLKGIKGETIFKTKLGTYGSNRILNGLNVSNVEISDIVLDGNASSFNIKANTNEDTLCYIKDSNNIAFDGVEVKNYASDFATLIDAPVDHYNHFAVKLFNCDGVAITNFTISNSKTEGLGVINSKNVVIEKFKSFNNKQIWTPLHVFNLDNSNIPLSNNHLKDISITDSTGSGLNVNGNLVYVEDVLIEDYGIKGTGRAIEVGDVEIFRNLHFKNITINNAATISYTGARYGFTLMKCIDSSIENLNISNCEHGVIIEDSRNIDAKNIVVTNCSTTNSNVTPTAILIRNSNNIECEINVTNSINGILLDSCTNIKLYSMLGDCTNICRYRNASNIDIGIMVKDTTGTRTINGILDYIENTDNVVSNNINIKYMSMNTTLNYDITLHDNNLTNNISVQGTSKIYATKGQIKNIISRRNQDNHLRPQTYGNYNSFIDDLGEFRIKNGTPTTQYDGDLIGEIPVFKSISGSNPNVDSGSFFILSNASATDLSGFTTSKNKRFTIVFKDANSTLKASIFNLKGGIDWTPGTLSSITFVKIPSLSSKFIEIARSER